MISNLDLSERQQQLQQELLVVLDELSSRKQRLERISREVVELEHKLEAVKLKSNFKVSRGMELSTASNYAKGVKRKLGLIRIDQQRALEELRRAVERQELLEAEMRDLGFEQEVLQIDNENERGSK